MTVRTEKIAPQRRDIVATFKRADDVTEENPEFELSFSSEIEVERWFGTEILSHDKSAADLSRINDGGVLLFNHNRDAAIGSIVPGSAKIDGKRGVARVQFFDDEEGRVWRGRVERGELRTVSFAYRIHELTERVKDGKSTYTATRWEALEISLVTIPADPSVGFGRAETDGAIAVQITTAESADATQTRSLKMPDIETAPAPNTQPVNAEVLRTETLARERTRVATIQQMGELHGLADLARNLIAEGVDLEPARIAVLAEIGKRGQKPVAGQTPITVDLSPKEQRSYSLCRAILHQAGTKGFEKGLEVEVSEYIRAQTDALGIKSNNGILIPANLPIPYVSEDSARTIMGDKGIAISRMLMDSRDKLIGQRATYAVGAAATGGNLVATELLAGSFIDILRNRAMVNLLGATMLSGLVGNIDIPRRNGATAVYWTAEGAGPTKSEGTFDKVSLSPKTIGTLSQMTRLMLLQATPDIEALVRADLAAVMALGIDLASINGSGASNQPLGILQTAGIGAIAGGTNGAAPTWAHMVGLETELAIDNADLGNMAYLTNAKMRGKLKTTEKFTNGGKEIWQPGNAPGFGEVNGYRAAVSNQVPSTLTKGSASGICSAMIFGNWSDLLIGLWGALEVLANPFGTGFAAGDLEVRSLQSVDIDVRHPESFSAMTDALTT